MPWRDQFVTEAAFLTALRDWFAGEALATLAASELLGAGEVAANDFAVAAYEIADAMLARRSGEGSP